MTFEALRDMLSFVRDLKNIKEVPDDEVDPYKYALDTLQGNSKYWQRLMTSEFELNELRTEYFGRTLDIEFQKLDGLINSGVNAPDDGQEIEIIGGDPDHDIDWFHFNNW